MNVLPFLQIITTEAWNHTHNINRSSPPTLLISPQTGGSECPLILASCVIVSHLVISSESHR